MFADFNKVFKSDQQAQLTIPSKYIKYLNDTLPEGMEYNVDKRGNCVITTKDDKFTISGFEFAPNDEQKKILGDHFTFEDLFSYINNSQQPMKLKLKKEGIILLNGKKVRIEKIKYNLFNPIRKDLYEFYMYPQKFQNPVSIKVGCSKCERTVKVKRVPHNSVSIHAYESEEKEAFFIKFLIDTKKDKFKLNFSLNVSNAKKIRDIVEFASIYNAFIDGNGTFLGKPLKSKLENTDVKKFDSNSILFWEKVLKIEETLSVSFEPPLDDVNFDTMCLVEELYQNLINKVPIRRAEKIDSIDFDYSNKAIDKLIGKSIRLMCKETRNFELFGITIELQCINYIFNSVIEKYDEKDQIHRIILVDESENKKQYTSSMCCESEDELEKYNNAGRQDNFELFRDAKAASEYLKY